MRKPYLREQEGYWSILNQHAADGVLVCDGNARLVFLNEVAAMRAHRVKTSE